MRNVIYVRQYLFPIKEYTDLVDSMNWACRFF